MRKVYNQKNLTITVDGVTMRDFMDGASVTIQYDGGEVDKTQGTDGAGINLATNQGMTLQFTLREESRSREFLKALRLRQDNGGSGVTVVIRTGVNMIHTLTDAYISQPAALSTGDKKMGGVQYTLMSASEESSNMGLDSAFGAVFDQIGF